jgi:hypothetical protein
LSRTDFYSGLAILAYGQLVDRMAVVELIAATTWSPAPNLRDVKPA